MTVGRDLCKAGGNESTFHKQVVILDMSFQQVLKTGQACFTHTHTHKFLFQLLMLSISLKNHPSSRHELASKMESISSTLPVSRDGCKDYFPLPCLPGVCPAQQTSR